MGFRVFALKLVFVGPSNRERPGQTHLSFLRRTVARPDARRRRSLRILNNHGFVYSHAVGADEGVSLGLSSLMYGITMQWLRVRPVHPAVGAGEGVITDVVIFFDAQRMNTPEQLTHYFLSTTTNLKVEWSRK